MVNPAISDDDRARVANAVRDAEARSDGEIVTVLADRSDSYHDVALHWAVAVLIAVLAWAAFAPWWLEWAYLTVSGGWTAEPTLGQLLTLLLVAAVFKFTVSLLILRWMPLRLALTPGATKHRRVRRRAVALFKAAAERRTVGRTGVLLYLSLAEHRAEIVTDEAIHRVTDADCWGEAMTLLLQDVRRGRPADGIVAAVGKIGDVLAEHFPKTEADVNEVPDRLIEI